MKATRIHEDYCRACSELRYIERLRDSGENLTNQDLEIEKNALRTCAEIEQRDKKKIPLEKAQKIRRLLYELPTPEEREAARAMLYVLRGKTGVERLAELATRVANAADYEKRKGGGL
jgi:hypothetical protein